MALHTLEPERTTLHGQFSRDLAPALTSVAADVRLTQLVNGVRGVHVVLPHGAIDVAN